MRPRKAERHVTRPTRAQLDAGTIRFVAATDAVRAVIQQAVKWGALGWIAYRAGLAIEAFAGSSTAVDVALEFLLNTSPGITITFSVAFGISGVGYGLAERRLRERRTGQMASRIKELESLIDPLRSGSGLTARGKPRPRDAGG